MQGRAEGLVKQGTPVKNLSESHTVFLVECTAAMVCHLKITGDGTLKSWRFSRAKVCIAANIAYEDAQAAMDASEEDTADVASPVCFMPPIEGAVPQELVDKALKPLWACWRALFAAGCTQARCASGWRLTQPRAGHCTHTSG